MSVQILQAMRKRLPTIALVVAFLLFLVLQEWIFVANGFATKTGSDLSTPFWLYAVFCVICMSAITVTFSYLGPTWAERKRSARSYITFAIILIVLFAFESWGNQEWNGEHIAGALMGAGMIVSNLGVYLAGWGKL